MGKSILTVVLLLVSVVLVSGCTEQTDIGPLIKQLPEVQALLDEHPDADIKLTLWSEESVMNVIDQVREDCGAPIEVGPYYKLTVSEEGTTTIIWIEKETPEAVCVLREGVDKDTSSEEGPEVFEEKDAEVQSEEDYLSGYAVGLNEEEKESPEDVQDIEADFDIPSCEIKYLDEYQCFGDWLEQKYQYSDCSTTWELKDICEFGCTDEECNPEPQVTSVDCKVTQLTYSSEDETNAEMRRDGKKIVYYGDYSTSGVWVMDTDGSRKEFVTDGYDASWHPTKNKLVYSDGPDIKIMDLTTKAVTQLTNDRFTTSESNPSFSPDGSKVVYQAYQKGTDISLYIINAYGTNKKQIVTRGYDPDWSPNEDKIVYAVQEETSPYTRSVWIYNVGSGKKEQIATGDESSQVTTGPIMPSFGPDGSKIVYTSQPEGSIWMMDIDGSNKVELLETNDPGIFGDTSWTYNEKILYTGSRGRNIYKADCSGELGVSHSSAPESSFEEILEVSYVVDGDTIELSGGERVRLICIDTPERGEPYYSSARDRLIQLILNKEIDLIEDVSETDRYGRLLRYVELNGQDINKVMISEGYAKVYRYPPDTLRCDEYEVAEEQAKSQGLGIWAEEQKPRCEEKRLNEYQCQDSYWLNQKYQYSDCSFTWLAYEACEYGCSNGGCKSGSSTYICSYNAYNCANFATQSQAQALFEACGGVNNDIHWLDGDDDGTACESLP